MSTAVPNVKLYNGHEMPIFGLGTWKSSPGQVGQAVEDAIDIGYRHIDCAYIYQNENEVGAALKKKIDSGAVSRDQLFITSKLWNCYHSPELVEPALRKTLELLGLEYLDLYLIHWPIGFANTGDLFPVDADNKCMFKKVDHLETWKAMEKCVELGLVRSIGLSNFNSKQTQHVLDGCKIKPAVNQVECHPYLNQTKLIKFCQDNGIAITAYSPLGSPDRPWAKPEDPALLQDPKLLAIAANHNKSCAQLLIRYQIQRGVIVIPKSVTKSRIAENFDVFNFELSEEDIKVIDAMDCNGRFCDGVSWIIGHDDYPFAIEF